MYLYLYFCRLKGGCAACGNGSDNKRAAFKRATCCGQVAPPPATSWLWTGAKVASAQESSGNHRVDFQDMIKFELTMGNLRSVSHVMPPCSLTKFLFVVYTCCVVLTCFNIHVPKRFNFPRCGWLSKRLLKHAHPRIVI